MKDTVAVGANAQGYSGQSDGDDQMGAKIKTQKTPRASNKPKKIPGPKINPPQKFHAKFPSLQIPKPCLCNVMR